MSIGLYAQAPPSLRQIKLGAYSSSSDLVFSSNLADPKAHTQERAKDFGRYGLTAMQCSSEFKSLFHYIERAVAYRNKIGHVKESDIDLDWKPEGAMRVMIYNHKLYVLESKVNDDFMVSRALSTLHQIDRAIATSPESLPDIEFTFVVSDVPDIKHQHHTFWSLSRLAIDEEMWLMPDFGYWSWPVDLVGNYEQIRAEIEANEVVWEEKVPKALWRGAVKTNKVRSSLMRVSQGKSWADVHEVRWKNRTDIAADSADLALSIVDHCGYQFLIHTEGRSYSGRGKYLLNCRSVTIMHKSEWIEPHQRVLVRSGPDQNFVEVESDFSDLESKIQELLQDSQRAKMIANNSAKTFRERYLTPAAQTCYWRQLIRSWAEVSFQPKPWVLIDGRMQLRGMPFETFV
ncbi:hypothetical protein BU24DRAFT_474962 [Aaosphaeria arxii CBS 175.79]|uniref:Glycosyl transferase CAP10 domain-containing protein n=1 Tax=Aaosphaeria arxii CBS 175.79 TaxID=1450172 RepID=A0A6A5X785_9PLEO|nr:uncharacterized protein BU24DRAFT_474962 [Aaosphaeria arxii CBS 175.79]KAF2008885.1 hypothetical protein BU24DRAFT_474962 [Aaosphaeria arxii CBS 175.79]